MFKHVGLLSSLASLLVLKWSLFQIIDDIQGQEKGSPLYFLFLRLRKTLSPTRRFSLMFSSVQLLSRVQLFATP